MYDDLSYYAARAAQERRRAMASAGANVQRIHLELAAQYAIRAGASAEKIDEKTPDPNQQTAQR